MLSKQRGKERKAGQGRAELSTPETPFITAARPAMDPEQGRFESRTATATALRLQRRCLPEDLRTVV